MKFPHLKSFLAEDDGITSGARDVFGKVVGAYKAAGDAVKKGFEEAEAKRKETLGELSAQETAKLKNDTKDFLNRFFEKYPDYTGDPDSQDIIDQIKTMKMGKAVYVIYKGMAADLQKLQDGINKAAVSMGVKNKDIQKMVKDSEQPTAALAKETVDFARSEAEFFKSLLQLDSDFEIDGTHFIQRLNAQMKKTAPANREAAIKQLNILLASMRRAMKAYAAEVAQVSAKLPEEPEA